MTSLRNRALFLCLIFFVALIMVGCGGGGERDNNTNTGATGTGNDLKYATGSVSGIVFIKDTMPSQMPTASVDGADNGGYFGGGVPLANATVQIDCQKVKTDSCGKFFIPNVKLGSKQLTVTKKEFSPSKTRIIVNRNQTTCVQICMKPYYCGWDWQNPVTNGANLYGASFVCKEIGYVCGARGLIMKTKDCGNRFKELCTQTYYDLYAINFPESEEVGWAVGYNTIIKTCDDGKTWQDQMCNIVDRPTEGCLTFYSVHFIDEQNGWVAGTYENNGSKCGVLLYTTDGGACWKYEPITCNPVPTELYSVFAADCRNIYVAGKVTNGSDTGIVYQLIINQNNNRTWLDRTPYVYGQSVCAYYSLDFEDLLNGYVVGDGAIYATQNAGASWHIQYKKLGKYVKSVVFDDDQGVACGANGLLLYSGNGGHTWRQRYSPTKADLNYATFGTDYIAWAVGDYGVVVRSCDRGWTWKNKTSVTTATFEKVFFVDACTGWAVGDYGTILFTDDGGKTWWTQSADTKEELVDVFFYNDQLGWIVSDKGNIFMTTNMGEDWKKLDSPVPYGTELEAVYFITAEKGLVVGDKGAIFMTEDGGCTWDDKSVGGDYELEDILFVGKKHGWIVSEGGCVLRSTDGGESWISVNVGPEDLEAASFVDTKHGWVVGESGAIYFTYDGGCTWIKQYAYCPPADLTDVYFTDCFHGYAVGTITELQGIQTYGSGYYNGCGVLLFTFDGGCSWWCLPTPGEFYGIYFVDANTGWAVGEHGFIVKTITSGVPCYEPSPSPTPTSTLIPLSE